MPSIGVLIGTAVWIALAYGAWHFWNRAPMLAQEADRGAVSAASAEPAKPAGQAYPSPQQAPADEPTTAAMEGQPAEAPATAELARATSPEPVPAGQVEGGATESSQAEPGQVVEAAKNETVRPPLTPPEPAAAAPPAAPPQGVRLKRPELSRLALELRVAQAKLEAARTMLDRLCRLGPAEIDEREYAGDAIAQ
ncbi:MAG TPA: hypothetical protein VFY92_01145, partial [Hyphomicrobiaceae bacterium]|nr:hypothetical protein [Hyphomicrobiaceae bacterium]